MPLQAKDSFTFMKNKIWKITLILAVLFTLVLLGYLPVGNNVWQIITSREYIIPGESSIFTFRPTVMNEGSGEWWLYGEDRYYFYHFVGSSDVSYLKISKAQALRCKGFYSQDHTTWCKACP